MSPGVVALLLQRGADPDVPHETQGPPLLHCAAWGETELAILLLDKGATVLAADALGHPKP
jgi:ankyrin repeat protein